ncbi:lytic polysaccharide monooxygenase [Pleomassaria siparia CBS 279.74]|uniref:AA9 family lytic polysaccharide monooxygenase n=1 Tax=Pleomassaria siparia CBS 279.74 TaxID=1314801 RepID=A0A6G1KQH3_9PLEO|nr:lytic polysaccharide monooxygenase [Pleomassaria siparia CBS 279.74]
MHHSKISTFLAAIVRLVEGHGGGMHYYIDGNTYVGTGADVDSEIDPAIGSIQRLWNWDGFYYTNWDDSTLVINSPNMACGSPGTPYAVSPHAPITAGSVVAINYTLPGSNPPWSFGHPIGPMLAYMAACPDSGCESVDTKKALWFKIWQAGLEYGNYVEGKWAMRDVFEGGNQNIPIPKTLKGGKYLLRHEMINLQSGPVQFFPNCVQLDVKSEGSSLPKEEELVAFPSVYDANSGTSWPGQKEGSEWFYTKHGKDTVYPMPGPSIWGG